MDISALPVHCLTIPSTASRQQDPTMTRYQKDPDAIARLSPEAFRVTQQNGTERPFSGIFDKHNA
ncbi:MAG: hypothetical protein ACC619_09700, partial [Paracoccaceae bacterium]